MKITPDRIRRYQELILQKKGERLSDTEAARRLQSLSNVISVLLETYEKTQ